MTAGFRALFVAAAAAVGQFPYLLPSGGSVDGLAGSGTADGENVLAVGGGHGDGDVPGTD